MIVYRKYATREIDIDADSIHMKLIGIAEEQNNSKERRVVDKCTSYAHKQVDQVDNLRGMD